MPRFGTAVLLLLMLLALPATAQEGDGPGRLRVGLSGVVMSAGGFWGSGLSLGGSPTFDFQVGRRFFVGLGPQASVKLPTSVRNSIVMLDLLLRLGRVSPLSERVQFFWYLAPGYSAIFTGRRTVTMPNAGVHVGGALDLGDGVYGTLELGYQLAWSLDLADSPVFLTRSRLAVGLLIEI